MTLAGLQLTINLFVFKEMKIGITVHRSIVIFLLETGKKLCTGRHVIVF